LPSGQLFFKELEMKNQFLKIVLILAVIFTGINCRSLNRNKTDWETNRKNYKPMFFPKKARTLPLQSGEWDGRYMDINGYDLILKLNVDVQDTVISGSATTTMIDIHGGRETQAKPLKGTVKGDSVWFSFIFGDEDPTMMHFKGIVEEQSIQTMRGTAEADSSRYFYGGVWLLFRFKQ
jgi:hypothetical protein